MTKQTWLAKLLELDGSAYSHGYSAGLEKGTTIILLLTILPTHIQNLEKRLADAHVSKGVSEVLNGKMITLVSYVPHHGYLIFRCLLMDGKFSHYPDDLKDPDKKILIIQITSSRPSEAIVKACPVLSAMSESYTFLEMNLALQGSCFSYQQLLLSTAMPN
ncbi:hypothetical protein M5689_011713 [Euphorbia peplus]|nr:hypothetical protein M5689_011713 [Euphorbia peplus]